MPSVCPVCFKKDLIVDSYVLFQGIQKAKQKGEQALLVEREKLQMHLEKLGRRIEEFPHCSELDMIEQVECL